MNQELLIRPMNESDVAKMGRQFTFPWSNPEKTAQTWKNYYEEQQQGLRSVILLEMGEILGYGSLLRESRYPFFLNLAIPEVHDLWIDQKYRRQGFGKTLIKAIEQRAKEENYLQIGLGVGLYKDYGQAQRLYISLGYIPVGEGITYKSQTAIAGESYLLDDDLLLWLIKTLR